MTNILNLPEVLLHHVLDFVKTEAYAIIGPVCRVFRKSYKPSQRITRTSKFFQSTQLFQRLPFQPKNPRLLDDLISRDEIDIIPLILNRGYEWDHFSVETAAAVGSFRFFRWLQTTELPWMPENAHHSAALAGNLGMMIFLVEYCKGYPDSRALMVARDRGFLNIVGWLAELELDRRYVMVRAAREDDVYMFEQTEQEGFDEEYVHEACVYGSFDVLEYFRQREGFSPTARHIAAAKHFQQFEVLD